MIKLLLLLLYKNTSTQSERMYADYTWPLAASSKLFMLKYNMH